MKMNNIGDMTPSSPPDPFPIHHDPVQEIELGCMHRSLLITTNTIHLLQFLTGITALSYAIAISFRKTDPQHGIATILELYALLLITASSMGTMGLSKPNCKRITLKISIWTAPFLLAWNVILALVLLAEKSSVLRYIAEKHDALYLSDIGLKFVQNHFGKFCVILFIMAAVEGMRFYSLKSLKEKLADSDEEYRRDMLRAHAQSSAAARRRWDADPHGESRELGTPLLSDQFEGRGDSSANSSFQQQSSLQDSDVSSSWWEEPVDDRDTSHIDSVEDSNISRGSWMSRVFKSPKKTDKSALALDEEVGGGGSASSVDFAPIDGKFETGTTPWDVSSDEGDADGDKDKNQGADLSWAKDETDL
jgi:hypothetical protein